MMHRKKTSRIPFPHRGETIREDYLKPLGMSVKKLALDLRVPATRMTEIVNRRRGIIADTALRLARYFNTTAKFWLNLQASYDLAKTAETKLAEIERNVRPRAKMREHTDSANAPRIQPGATSQFEVA